MKRKEKETSKTTASWKDEAVTKPLPAIAYVVKCVYSSPLVVVSPATRNKYRFEPGAQKTITDKRDYDHLLSLKREAGRSCCGGGSDEPRRYFEKVTN